MLRRIWLIIPAWLITTLVCFAANVNEFRLVFPHVVKGSSGVYYETLITVSNAGDEALDVTLVSEELDFESEGLVLKLAPKQTRQFRIQGEPIQIGAVSLAASRPVAASAVIVARPRQSLEEALAQASIFGSPPMARAALPVFVRSAMIDNTGLALFYFYPAAVDLRFTLFDLAGRIVATRTARTPFNPNVPFAASNRASFFVTELFPALPQDFSQGLLVIEQISPPQVPDTFALIGLYARGNSFWTAEVTAVDDVRDYVLTPKSLQNIQQTAEQLAQRYGFQLQLVVADRFVTIRSTKEIARAVARDPLVKDVSSVIPLTLSSR